MASAWPGKKWAPEVGSFYSREMDEQRQGAYCFMYAMSAFPVSTLLHNKHFPNLPLFAALDIGRV